jgi:DNA-binding transcriptional LysR family regulator
LLTGVSVLTAIIEGGSFVRAAEALGITASGVSRALARLEARIGVRLLDRTTRSVSLSEEGRRFYERVRPCLEGIEEAATDASGAANIVRGKLRVNIDPLVSRIALAGRLGGFLQRHPDLTLELITREQIGDLVSDGIDVAVRFGTPTGASLVARKLVDTRVLTVAAPAYLARHGRPKHPQDLAGHACIHFRDPTTSQPFPWEFHKNGKMLAVKTMSRLMLSDAGTMFTECMAGTGIGQVNENAVRHYLEQGHLIELFPEWNGETFPLYALYPSRQNPPARVRAFIDFIVQTIG